VCTVLVLLLALGVVAAHAAPPAPPAAASAPALTPNQAEALVREISAKVEQIRGLKFSALSTSCAGASRSAPSG
jgi:hypothetical protein